METSTATETKPKVLVAFKINDEIVTLTESQLKNFPVQDAYLNVLWRNLKTSQFNVETTDKGEIIVKAVSGDGRPFKNFSLVARLYQDPSLPLFNLLQVNSFLRLVENVKSHYPIVQKKLQPNSTMPQYDSINIEHENIIKQHPTYKWLKRLGYEKLREEFKFYGIDDLPNLNPGSNCESLNPVKLLERFEEYFFHEMSGMQLTMKDYHETFYGNTTLQEPSDTRECRQFLDNVKAMGGAISGSLVLKTVLEEAWETSDIDIYVSEENLHNFICKNVYQLKRFSGRGRVARDDASSYVTDHVMSARTTIITTELKAIQRRLRGGPPSYFEDLFATIANSPDEDMDSIEAKILMKVREEMMKDIVELFNGKDAKILSKRESIKAYNELNGVSYVIRFKFQGRKVDLVVTKCHVPFVIDNFDFAFNKVYYDGYAVNCMDWEAVSTKVCINNYCWQSRQQNDIEKYVYNIERIRKYFQRGFVVLL